MHELGIIVLCTQTHVCTHIQAYTHFHTICLDVEICNRVQYSVMDRSVGSMDRLSDLGF